MRTHRLHILVITVAALLLVAQSADARRRYQRRTNTKRPLRRARQHQNPVPIKDRLLSMEGTSNFMRNDKLHVAVKTPEAQKALTRLPNTVEFFVKKGYMHLFVRVKGVTFDRHNSVKATKWSDFKYKDQEQSGVLLELPRPLYKQLIKHLGKAKRDPNGTVGTFRMDGGKFPEQSNCTSWVSLAKMGDDRLVKALGIPRDAKGIGNGNPTRHPQSLINALIDHSPYTKAVIMRNHQRTEENNAKIDFTSSAGQFTR